MQLITSQQLKKICLSIKPGRADEVCEAINKVCPLYGIDISDILHEFLARLCVESQEFSRFEENLNYTTTKRLRVVWPKRFPTDDSALPFVRNPQKLAMKVYGKRRDLGNLSLWDGWEFRGSGPIQITGRRNVELFWKYMVSRFKYTGTIDQFVSDLRNNIEIGMHSACWIFAISKQLIDEALNNKLKEIVEKINGGLHGLDETLKYYELCKKYIP